MMTLTAEEKKKLRGYKTNPDSDDVHFKEIIKKHLLANRLILYTLNDTELQQTDAPADDYYGKNILPYYLIHPTQTDIQNYVCYEVQFDEEARYNDKFKYCQIVFTILCNHANIIDEITRTPRQDLLAALIYDEFNWTNHFGFQVHVISDEPSVVDTEYACRTIVLEGKMFNNLIKTKNGISKPVNSEVHVDG